MKKLKKESQNFFKDKRVIFNMKKLLKMVFKFIIVCIILIIVIIIIAEYTIVKSSKDYIFDSAEQLPDSQVVLVLGTSPRAAGGRQNLFYIYRINAAKHLYDLGKAKAFIVSGDNRKLTYNEPQAMQNSLEELGVPKEIIYPDYTGFRTLDSVIRINKIFGQKTFIIVSQKFHNERAVYIARKNGLNAYAYNAEDVPVKYSPKTFIRERFARVKVFIDILFKKQPKFLGEPVEIK